MHVVYGQVNDKVTAKLINREADRRLCFRIFKKPVFS